MTECAKVMRSVSAPPSISVVPARLAAPRFDNVARSAPAPKAMDPVIAPPPQANVSVPVPVTTPLPIVPPDIVKLLVPLPRSTSPPMLPPTRVNVSLFCRVTTSPTIVPPDMKNTLLPTFMSTEPIEPPVIVAKSPSVNAPTIVPPDRTKMSSPPP